MARNSDYWQKRFEILQETLLNKADNYYEELAKEYNKASMNAQDKIMAWYIRLMNNNEISLARAKQILKNNELKEFKWTLEEYINYGKENSFNQQWVKELENASAMVHITKLEAIKIQIQHQVEVLINQQSSGITELLKETFAEGYYQTAYEVQKGLNQVWNIQKLDTSKIEKVMSKPWTVDGKTFSDRIWSNKEQLVDTLHKELTQSIIRGDAPDKVIKTVANKFDVSKKQAGRVVMTESAFMSSASRKESYINLGVEEYKVVATLDLKTSKICRDLDGKIFKVIDFQPGVTANPFHPYCRTSTAPHFDDIELKGERAARDPVTDKMIYVDNKMTYSEWYEKYVKDNPQAELKEKKTKNATIDKKQYGDYKNKLGADYIPNNFDDFQNLKYTNESEYGILKSQVKGMTYYEKAVTNELEITKNVNDIARTLDIDTIGLEYRIKSKDSYLRKIRTNYRPAGNEYEINDILRYTYGIDIQNLTDKTLHSIDKYSTLGYNTVKIKNSWLDNDNPYNGINTIIQAPNGQKFELQYHTPESFELKNGKLHELYEKQRLITDEESAEFITLRNQMFELSDKLTVPDGIERIK